MTEEEIYKNLLYFKPFIMNKNLVEERLGIINTFPEFNEYRKKIKSENTSLREYEVISRSLSKAVQEKKLSYENLDELLFLLIEDRLFDSYLYSLKNNKAEIGNEDSIRKILEKWKVPTKNNILDGISQKNVQQDFVICGFRTVTNERIRLLLLDKKLVDIKAKNKDIEPHVYATIIDFDFERSLVHIRIKDVDKIESENRSIATLKGRIERTLAFINNLKPSINYEHLKKFKTSIFSLEEALLTPKRNTAEEALKGFIDNITDFSIKIDEDFSPEYDNEVNTFDYIKNVILTVISSSLELSPAGDVTGIRFRNKNEENDNSRYAEISIIDKSAKCISTSALYWSNLSTLLREKKVEFLKISKVLDSGKFVDVNVTNSLGTGNVKLNYSSYAQNITVSKKPTDDKYSDFIDYLLPFINECRDEK